MGDDNPIRSVPGESKDDFELLAIRYLDGLSTADQSRILSDQLASSAEKRRQFAALSVQIGVLSEMVKPKQSPAANMDQALSGGDHRTLSTPQVELPNLYNHPVDVRQFLHVERFAPSFVSGALRIGHRWLVVSPWRIAGPSLAIALLIAGLLWIRIGEPSRLSAHREPQMIASLTDGSQAKWREGQSVPNGTQLSEGRVLELSGGQAQISMSCGAEIVMRAPCSVELASANHLLLHEGLLSVQLADWTNGFTVATESVQILDLGKQFVVSADAKSGVIEAHAIDGKLRVQAANMPADKRYGLLVGAGEAIRIQPANNTSVRLKANEILFDASLDESRPYKPVEVHNTGRGLTPGDEDQHWRIVSSSAEDFNGPRYAVACRHFTNIYLPNDPAVSQWISISNPVDDNCPPDTMYTFETEFDLTEHDLSTVTMVAHVLADNGVMGVRINGHKVDFTPWSAVYGLFDTFHKIEITDGFVQGVNRIQFDVWNSVVMSYPDDYNPMALRVEWQAFGRLKRQAIARSESTGFQKMARRELARTASISSLFSAYDRQREAMAERHHN